MAIVTYKTADGMTVKMGDRVFNYYGMVPGRIGLDRSTPREPGWFEFLAEGGGRDLLNGERICSIRHAERMGWYAAGCTNVEHDAVTCREAGLPRAEWCAACRVAERATEEV